MLNIPARNVFTVQYLFEWQCMSRENYYLIAVLDALLTQVLKMMITPPPPHHPEVAISRVSHLVLLVLIWAS